MKLYLIRHGKSRINLNRILFSRAHGVMSDAGWRTTRYQAENLKDYKLDCIYVSDLHRCFDTAKEIKKNHPNISIKEIKGLEGFSSEADRRVVRFLRTLGSKHRDQNVLLVTHSGVIRRVIDILEDLGGEYVRGDIKVPYTKVFEAEIGSDGAGRVVNYKPGLKLSARIVKRMVRAIGVTLGGLVLIAVVAGLILSPRVAKNKVFFADDFSARAIHFADEVASYKVTISSLNAGSMMEIFPGLELEDFVGVETFGGKYDVVDSQIVLVRDADIISTVDEDRISRAGYFTLYNKLALRFGVSFLNMSPTDEVFNNILFAKHDNPNLHKKHRAGLRVSLSPKKERYCLGEDVLITVKAPPEVDSLRLRLVNSTFWSERLISPDYIHVAGEEGGWGVADFTWDFTKTFGTRGREYRLSLPEYHVDYFIEAEADARYGQIYGASYGLFSIEKCR